MDNSITSIFGRKGSGKTTLAKAILQEHARALVLDPQSEYHDLPEVIVERSRRLAILRLADLARLPQWHLVVQGLEPPEYLSLLRVAWELRDALVVIDEAHEYGTAWKPAPEVAKLVRLGRHRGLSSLFVSQRPSDVARIITSQSDAIVAFRQHEERDVRFLHSIFGPQAEELRQLPKYQAIAFGDAEKIPTAVLELAFKRGLTLIHSSG